MTNGSKGQAISYAIHAKEDIEIRTNKCSFPLPGKNGIVCSCNCLNIYLKSF